MRRVPLPLRICEIFSEKSGKSRKLESIWEQALWIIYVNIMEFLEDFKQKRSIATKEKQVWGIRRYKRIYLLWIHSPYSGNSHLGIYSSLIWWIGPYSLVKHPQFHQVQRVQFGSNQSIIQYSDYSNWLEIQALTQTGTNEMQGGVFWDLQEAHLWTFLLGLTWAL